MELVSELPLYESIKRDLQTRIDSGELPEGARILPEIELAKRQGVSRSTARKALLALEQEGYLVRTAGLGTFVKSPKSALQTGLSTQTMAITVQHLARFNHSGEMVQGFMNEAVGHGFHAMIHPPIADNADEFEYLLNVRRSGINGWALWLKSASEKNLSLLRGFQKSGHALVLVDRYAPGLDADSVVAQNETMAYQLTRELLRRGHQDVGLINFPLDCTVTTERQKGYQRALSEAGAAYENDLVVIDQIQGVEALRMQMLGLLSRRHRPTAIVCASAHHAWCLIKELDRLNYIVHDDIELALVDDNRFAEQSGLNVLTATQHSYEMGRLAAKLLWQRLENPTMPYQHLYTEHDLNFTPGP